MTKEIFGMLMGWALLTIGCWFLSLTIVGYTLGEINPLKWDNMQRGIHLLIQALLICLYLFATRLRRGG